MMNPSSLFGGLAKWLQGTDTEPLQEARQQRLNKSAKIQSGLEAAIVNQINTIAKDEIAEARQYKDQKIFGGTKRPPQRGTVDDMLIADDIRITTVKPGNGVLPTLLGLAAGAALVYFVAPLLVKPAKEAVQSKGETVIEHNTESFDYEVDSKVIPPH